jgi:poly(hydroxyalkanoate) depolymerase family esterase
MTPFAKINLMQAARLSHEGRFKEALAVLCGAAAAPSDLEGSASERAERPSSIIDMVPPAPGGGGAWTARPAFGASAGLPRGRSQAEFPEAVRGLMERMKQARSSHGLDRQVEPAARPPIPVPDGARFEERSFVNEAGSRPYKLYVPSGYAGEPLPLVVMLHGCTQSPDDFAAGTQMNAVAEEQTFFVVYPGQTKAANASKCWNWFSAGDQQRDRGEPSLIAGITRQVMRDFPVAPGRVYIAGLSAGGAAAAIMGSTYPDLYAAIGVHSGLACGAASDLPSAFAAMKNGGAAGARRPGGLVPTIVFHGDRDTTVFPVNGDEVIAQAKTAADLCLSVSHGEAPGGIKYTRTVYADDGGRAMLEHWLLHGAGHAWSGGSTAGSYSEPRGPDASREMMRFFREQAPVTTAAS